MAGEVPFFLSNEPQDPLAQLGLANYLNVQSAQVPPDQAQINHAVLNQPAPIEPSIPTRAPAQADPRALKALQKYLPPKPLAKPASPEQIDAYTGLSEKSIADQQATLAGLNQYIDQIAQKPTGLNLSPLAAFIDSYTGSKLAPAAQSLAPMSADEKDKMLFGLRNQLATGQEKLSNDRLQALQYAQTQKMKQAHDEEVERHNRVMEANQASRGDGMNIRGQVAQDNQVIGVGKAWENDHIIKTSKESINSLVRSKSILDNTTKPLTAYDLGLAYNDYINAVAKGGAATEGKIHRELPSTFEQDLNAFKLKFGEASDLRKSPAGAQLVDMLKKNIHTVNSDLGLAIKDQNEFLTQNYSEVTHNPAVHQAVAKKNKQYSDYVSKLGEDHSQKSNDVHNEAVDWARANPNDPRAQKILKLNGM